MRTKHRTLVPVFRSLVAGLVLGACNSSQSGVDDVEDMTSTTDSATVSAVREAARPLSGAATDYDSLVAMASAARVVFLGEQTHGTHEFYRERARITQRLVREHGFRAIALEADWPEVERMNRYIHGAGNDRSATEALGAFTDFPRWMWRNTDVRELVDWLRSHNATRPPEQRVSLYGLDVYSLYTSAEAVLSYLATVDPAASERVRTHYACFAQYAPDPQRYGASTGTQNCMSQAAAILNEMRQRAASTQPSDATAASALFSALRNAHAVVYSEEYFRSLYARNVSTWNLRDQRMEETLLAISEQLERNGAEPARMIVWAHNTHSGDARATQASEAGEHNVGQLLRQRLGTASLLVGFFTHHGTVMAAPEWDAPGRVFDVRPALAGSYADVFHAARPANFMLTFRDGTVSTALNSSRLERAIGVVYVPATERQSHYFLARLAAQFDVVVHFDETRAVTPVP